MGGAGDAVQLVKCMQEDLRSTSNTLRWCLRNSIHLRLSSGLPMHILIQVYINKLIEEVYKQEIWVVRKE